MEGTRERRDQVHQVFVCLFVCFLKKSAGVQTLYTVKVLAMFAGCRDILMTSILSDTEQGEIQHIKHQL